MKINPLTLGCLFTLCFSLTGFADGASHSSVLAAGGGRFVFGQTGSLTDQYLLDTETGRLWVLVSDKDGKRVFEPILFKSLDGKRLLFPQHVEEDGRKGAPILRDLEKDVQKPQPAAKTAPKADK